MIVIDPLLYILIVITGLYYWVVIASVILSWLVGFNVINTRNPFVASAGNFLWQMTEPALRPIRRMVPSFGKFDISPIILILILIFIEMVLGNIRNALHGY
jgi:YggT family protein